MPMNFPDVDAYFSHGQPVMVKHTVGETAIKSGDVLVFEHEIRIAHNDHEAGSLAGLSAPGGNAVYRMPKAGEDIDDGEKLYWDESEDEVTVDADGGANLPAGFAVGSTLQADSHAFVRFDNH